MAISKEGKKYVNDSLNIIHTCGIRTSRKRTCYNVVFFMWLTISCDLCGRYQDRLREMFYLTTHSIHFIYGYMASDIGLRTILIGRKETRCRHIGYSFRLTARVLLYAPSHRQDNTYHSLCYTVVEHWLEREIAQWVHSKDRW